MGFTLKTTTHTFRKGSILKFPNKLWKRNSRKTAPGSVRNRRLGFVCRSLSCYLDWLYVGQQCWEPKRSGGATHKGRIRHWLDMTGVCSLCVVEPISRQSTNHLFVNIWYVHMLLTFSTESRPYASLVVLNMLVFAVQRSHLADSRWQKTNTDMSHTLPAHFAVL